MRGTKSKTVILKTFSVTNFLYFNLKQQPLFANNVGHIWFPLRNGILLQKLFCPTVRKNCSSEREKILKFEAEGREFAKYLTSLEQFIQTIKGQNNFW